VVTQIEWDSTLSLSPFHSSQFVESNKRKRENSSPLHNNKRQRQRYHRLSHPVHSHTQLDLPAPHDIFKSHSNLPSDNISTNNNHSTQHDTEQTEEKKTEFSQLPQTKSAVRVKTTKRIIECDYVIVTVPVSVLKGGQHAICFQPPLPQWKLVSVKL
jgi:hypothetical protein